MIHEVSQHSQQRRVAPVHVGRQQSQHSAVAQIPQALNRMAKGAGHHIGIKGHPMPRTLSITASATLIGPRLCAGPAAEELGGRARNTPKKILVLEGIHRHKDQLIRIPYGIGMGAKGIHPPAKGRKGLTLLMKQVHHGSGLLIVPPSPFMNVAFPQNGVEHGLPFGSNFGLTPFGLTPMD
jgi:hypothetical protein